MIEHKRLQLSPEVASELEKFVSDYQIVSPKQDIISCNLSGSSYAEFIISAQELGLKVFGRNLVAPEMLEGLQYRPEFHSRVAIGSTPLIVDATPKMPANEFYTRVDVDRVLMSLGQEMPPVADLAVAHLAHTFVRSRDLFDGRLGLAQDGSLYLSQQGLNVWSYGTVIGSIGSVMVQLSEHRFVPPAVLPE